MILFTGKGVWMLKQVQHDKCFGQHTYLVISRYTTTINYFCGYTKK